MSEHKKTRYSVEDKLYIVNRNLIDGVGQNKIAKQEGIARSSVNLWVKQYLEGGKEALQNQPPFRRSKIDLSAEADALKRENLLLKIENERLKKGYMVVDGKFVLLKKEYLIIQNLSAYYPISILCDILHIQRSTYYAWKKRKGSLNRYEEYRRYLYSYIKDIHKKHPSYGYHGIAATIRTMTDLVFSDLLIHKICKEYGIKSKAKHYGKKKKPKKEKIMENLIHGDWRTTAPMQKLVSDMTVLKIGGKKYEWCFVMDVYNHAIIASAISQRSGDTNIYRSCLKQVLKNIKKEEHTQVIYYHTDRGSVYTSRAHFEAHKDYNILLRSMSRPGTPTDNAIIEAMNGWIKAAIKVDYKDMEIHDIEAFINDYIYYFNHERPMYALGYVSPVSYTLAHGHSCSI